MSYRGFKRLLGETSLERKCRIILGGGIFVLVLASFIFFEAQTEKLVKEQPRLKAEFQARLSLAEMHVDVDDRERKKTTLKPRVEPPTEVAPIVRGPSPRSTAKKDETDSSELKSKTGVGQPIVEHRPAKTAEMWTKDDAQSDPPMFFRNDQVHAGSSPPKNVNWFKDENREVMELIRTTGRDYHSSVDKRTQRFNYWLAVRLEESCVGCHDGKLNAELKYRDDLQIGQLMGMIWVGRDQTKTDLAINVNRAILLSFAIATAILAVTFTYVTIRYVVVKPVSHLQKVSDEIAAGNLAIRADIRSGDEFEELSQAFNRMIRSLVSMQAELRKVNVDLDGKLDELARANMTLFELNRMKSEFLASISHELRTPLNSVLGFSDLLADEVDLEAKPKKWVRNIQSSGQMLMQLINDILDLAKLEAGKMQVLVEEFEARDLVDSLITLMKPLADKKQIALTPEIDPTLPLIKQDRQKIQQVLQNLVSNAVKFTPEGGNVVVSAKPDRAHLLLAVRDNGVGIAIEDQKIIFEKFRQAESTLTRQHGGTGLGLSIVRELTKLLGGDEVTIESELGKGSTFTVRLPITYVARENLDQLFDGEVFQNAKSRDLETRFFSSQKKLAVADSE